MKRIKTLLLVTALLVVTYLTVGLAASADGPFMEVRFLRVLVNAVVNGDLSVLDDLAVTDGITGASVAATGAVSGASGTFTTATIGSATVTTLTATGNLTADGLIANTGTYTDAVSAAGFTGPITATQVILGGTFTALRAGMIANATDGMTVTHNLGGEPLFVMLTPYGDNVTVTVGCEISDTTVFTLQIPDGVTVDTMYFTGN